MTKVRKVMSEVKYLDPPDKDTILNKKKESKSDNEITHEADVSLKNILSKIFCVPMI